MAINTNFFESSFCTSYRELHHKNRRNRRCNILIILLNILQRRIARTYHMPCSEDRHRINQKKHDEHSNLNQLGSDINFWCFPSKSPWASQTNYDFVSRIAISPQKALIPRACFFAVQKPSPKRFWTWLDHAIILSACAEGWAGKSVFKGAYLGQMFK